MRRFSGWMAQVPCNTQTLKKKKKKTDLRALGNAENGPVQSKAYRALQQRMLMASLFPNNRILHTDFYCAVLGCSTKCKHVCFVEERAGLGSRRDGEFHDMTTTGSECDEFGHSKMVERLRLDKQNIRYFSSSQDK